MLLPLLTWLLVVVSIAPMMYMLLVLLDYDAFATSAFGSYYLTGS